MLTYFEMKLAVCRSFFLFVHASSGVCVAAVLCSYSDKRKHFSNCVVSVKTENMIVMFITLQSL